MTDLKPWWGVNKTPSKPKGGESSGTKGQHHATTPENNPAPENAPKPNIPKQQPKILSTEPTGNFPPPASSPEIPPAEPGAPSTMVNPNSAPGRNYDSQNFEEEYNNWIRGGSFNLIEGALDLVPLEWRTYNREEDKALEQRIADNFNKWWSSDQETAGLNSKAPKVDVSVKNGMVKTLGVSGLPPSVIFKLPRNSEETASVRGTKDLLETIQKDKKLTETTANKFLQTEGMDKELLDALKAQLQHTKRPADAITLTRGYISMIASIPFVAGGRTTMDAGEIANLALIAGSKAIQGSAGLSMTASSISLVAKQVAHGLYGAIPMQTWSIDQVLKASLMGAAYSGAIGLEGVNALAELTAISKNGAMVCDTIWKWIKEHKKETAWTVAGITIASTIVGIGTGLYHAIRKTDPVLVSHVDHTSTMRLITTAHTTLPTPQTQLIVNLSTSSQEEFSTLQIASTLSALATSQSTTSIARAAGSITPIQTTQFAPISISKYIQVSDARSTMSIILHPPHITNTTKSPQTTNQATHSGSVRQLSPTARPTEVQIPETRKSSLEKSTPLVPSTNQFSGSHAPYLNLTIAVSKNATFNGTNSTASGPTLPETRKSSPSTPKPMPLVLPIIPLSGPHALRSNSTMALNKTAAFNSTNSASPSLLSSARFSSTINSTMRLNSTNYLYLPAATGRPGMNFPVAGPYWRNDTLHAFQSANWTNLTTPNTTTSLPPSASVATRPAIIHPIVRVYWRNDTFRIFRSANLTNLTESNGMTSFAVAASTTGRTAITLPVVKSYWRNDTFHAFQFANSTNSTMWGR